MKVYNILNDLGLWFARVVELDNFY
jgi:hypothetical protein